jgi:hypothetical protein
MLTAEKAPCVISAGKGRRSPQEELMKTFFGVVGFAASIMAGAIALAQPSEDEAIDKAIACRDIADDLERLACLDQAAETLAVTRIIREEAVAAKKQEERENFGLPGGGEKGPVVAETPEEFGAENLPKSRKEREEGKLKSITSKIAEVRINAIGVATLTLENGQVWRQLESDDKKLFFPSGDKLYTAKVKRSLFGNYMLTINELHKTIRVRRVE